MLAFDVQSVHEVTWLDVAVLVVVIVLVIRSFRAQMAVRDLVAEVERQRRFDMRVDDLIADLRSQVTEKTSIVKRIEDAKNTEEAEEIVEDLISTLKALENG